jgi:uncharacterized protein (DUF1778 family)
MKRKYPEPLDETDEMTEILERAFEETEAIYNLPEEEYNAYIDSLKPVNVRVAKDLAHFYSFRALAEELDLIGDGADLAGVDMSTFIRGAAVREARALKAAKKNAAATTKQELIAAKEAIERALAALGEAKPASKPRPESADRPRRRKRA